MKQISILIYLVALTTFTSAQHQTNLKINQEAAVIQSKSIIINETPEKIWRILSDVEKWNDWNVKIKKVRIDDELKLSSEFTWVSGGAKIKSKVHTYDFNKTLGWTGKTFGARAIHNWYFEETVNGTKITVEESMEGWLIGLMKKKMNSMLERDMTLWLEELKTESER